MTKTYRVVYTPTVFPSHRDFSSRAKAQNYLTTWALPIDPTACIVELDSTRETA